MASTPEGEKDRASDSVVYDDQLDHEAQKRSRLETISSYFTILCAGFALVSDGYQNNLMTMTNVVLQRLYPHDYTPSVSTRVSNASLVGAIIGQIIVGLICDRIGRKTAIVATTAFICVGAIIGTAAHGAHGSVQGLFWCLTFARGITGIGVGGEYPASSSSASEAANEKFVSRRGPIFIMVTNLMLNVGAPLSVSVFLIAISAAGQNHLNTVWRVCFGFGALLPITVFFFRMRMINSKLYRQGAIKRRVPYNLVLRRYWKRLIGTCGAWFLYDFVQFPNGIFSGQIISNVVKDKNIIRTAEWQLLLSTIAIPGVFVGAWLCDRLGRKQTMMLGFSGYLVFGLIIGIAFPRVVAITPLFVVFYGLLKSFGNLGPGDMLGLVSSESYATPVRGTCYGISAAIGKTGAALGTQAFLPIQTHLGKRWTFIIAAIVGVAGIVVTWLFVPNLTGEDLAKEDADFQAFLLANGWTGEVGEDDMKHVVVAEVIEVEDQESKGVVERSHV